MDVKIKNKKEKSFKERTASIIGFAVFATALLLFYIFVSAPYDYDAVGEERTGYVFFVTYRHGSARPGAARIPYIIVRERVQGSEFTTHRISFPAPVIRGRQTISDETEAIRVLSGQEITIRYYPNSTNSTVWLDPPYPPYGVQTNSYPHDYDAHYIEITGQISGMSIDWEAEPPTWTFGLRERVQEARFDRQEIRYPGTVSDSRRLLNTYVTVMYYPGGENATRLVSSDNNPSYPLIDEAGIRNFMWGAIAFIWVLVIVLIVIDLSKRRRRANDDFNRQASHRSRTK